jgi:ATP-binding protein involved in chromosome partitioning
MRRFRGYNQVEEVGTNEVLGQVLDQRRRLTERLSSVKHVVPVVSGKGGVGKSAVTANVAALLAKRGHRVGAVDADLNGPSLARMLGAGREPLQVTEDGVIPAKGAAGVALVSMDLLLPTEDAPLQYRGPEHDGFLWRGALETGSLREFLADLVWGELDYLLIDVPPGTDRIERLLDLVPSPSAAVLVAIPSRAALAVVSKSARTLVEAGLERVGLVLNMSGYVCPCCGCATSLFANSGSEAVLGQGGPKLWAEVPFDPELNEATDDGRPFALGSPDRPAAKALEALVQRLEQECPP